jgi:hypothetical protein
MISALTRNLAPRPASASLVWVTAAASLLLVLVLLLAGNGTLTRLGVPAGAVLVGLALYYRRPIGYLQFTLWTWFVTPLVRRLIDWRTGFEEHNLVLLVPFLVSAIAGLTLLRERRLAGHVHLTPFFLCIAGILYGFAVGLIRWELHASTAESLGGVIYGLFMWLAPLLFGLHLYLRWQDYEEQKQAILKSFVWAVLLLGIYGIYQYIAPPVWDRAWLESLPGGYANLSFGRPVPYEVRVWSASNSPGTFSMIMMAGLVMLFGTSSRYKIIFAAVGYLSFLLSMVRTSWLAWLLAMAILVSSYRGAVLRRSVFGLLLLPLVLLPVVFDPQIQVAVQDRIASMQNVNKDDSFQDRTTMYQVVTAELLAEPSGLGLVNSNLSLDGFALDSGLLQTALMLGLVGAALFGTGIVLAARNMIVGNSRALSSGAGFEEFAYRAIFLASVAEVIAGNIFVSVGGVILWVSLGLWMSASMWAKKQDFERQPLSQLPQPHYSDSPPPDCARA